MNEGVYIPSRPPGFPLYELIVGIFGAISVRALLIFHFISSIVFTSFVYIKIEENKHRFFLILIFFTSHVFLISSYSVIDYVIGSLLGFGGGAENKFMGGTVAAGSPYIVGERGPELFVPGASGSIVPNGAMGGAPVIVNNNSVNQSSNTANHQHSNVSITDSQQEITGL